MAITAHRGGLSHIGVEIAANTFIMPHAHPHGSPLRADTVGQRHAPETR
jgi:hypothetical protein